MNTFCTYFAYIETHPKLESLSHGLGCVLLIWFTMESWSAKYIAVIFYVFKYFLKESNFLYYKIVWDQHLRIVLLCL